MFWLAIAAALLALPQPLCAQEEPYDEYEDSPSTYVQGCGYLPAVKVIVDGIETEGRGFIRDGRAYLPAREVLEKVGGTVTWVRDGKSLYVASKDEGRTARLTVDVPLVDVYRYDESSRNHVGEKMGTIRLTAAPFQCEGRVFVPVRAATEAAGGTIRYDGASKTVHVTPPAHVKQILDRQQQ